MPMFRCLACVIDRDRALTLFTEADWELCEDWVVAVRFARVVL